MVIISSKDLGPVDVCGDSAGDNPAVVVASPSLAFTQRMVWLSKILLLTKIKNRNKDGEEKFEAAIVNEVQGS